MGIKRHRVREPYYHDNPIDNLEPELSRTDAIAELAERLRFAFAWMLDSKRPASVALRVYVAAHHFCPGYIQSETLEETGKRLGVSRQAVGKLSIDLQDVLKMRPSNSKSDHDRHTYRNSRRTRGDLPTEEDSGEVGGRQRRGATKAGRGRPALLGAWGSTTIKPREAPKSV